MAKTHESDPFLFSHADGPLPCCSQHKYSILKEEPQAENSLARTTAHIVDVLRTENVSSQLLEQLNISLADPFQRRAFIDSFNQLAHIQRVHHVAFESSSDTVLIAPEACGC